MKIANPKTAIAYWEEGQKHCFPWYKKGFFKKYLRNKFIRKRFTEDGKCN
jgi:hypothetical protein